jgi:hypothetical protein
LCENFQHLSCNNWGLCFNRFLRGFNLYGFVKMAKNIPFGKSFVN